MKKHPEGNLNVYIIDHLLCIKTKISTEQHIFIVFECNINVNLIPLNILFLR